MKVLAVIYANRVPNNDRLYEELAKHVAELEVRRVDGAGARHLAALISSRDIAHYKPGQPNPPPNGPNYRTSTLPGRSTYLALS